VLAVVGMPVTLACPVLAPAVRRRRAQPDWVDTAT
jgi:hypothetical protein